MKKRINVFITIFLMLGTFGIPAWAEETSTNETSSVEETSSGREETGSSTASQETLESVSSDAVSILEESAEPSTEPSQEFSESEPTTEDVKEQAVTYGAEDNPYLVTNFQELKAALNTPLANGQTTQYIQLQNDIVYNTTYTYIKQSTVIDGNGHALLYSGATYGIAHFSTNTSNINITYKNLSFGNDSYPNSTYYGILYVQAANNVNFTVENVNYNIKIGSQPFWGNNYAGNTLTFKGKNNFYSSSSIYGGEFVEGYRRITFAEDSDTTVFNDSTDATAVFWSTSQSITIEKRASLSIESSKSHLFYGSATANIQEQGKFSYKSIYGTKAVSSLATLSTGTLTMNFAKDSIGHFTTAVNSFSGISPILNLNSPDHIVFDAADSSKRVLGTMRPVFKRTDADTSTYGIDYLTPSGQKVYQPRIQPNTSTTVASGNIGNGYSVAYARYPSITSLAATPLSGTDISSLDAQVNAVEPATAISRSIQYKLASKTLYAGSDITTSEAQASIEQAGSGDGVLEAAVPLPENGLNTGPATKHSFQHLRAGNYYLYAQLEDQRITGYTLKSLWQEAAAEVPPFIQVQFSNSVLGFNSPIAGEFGRSQNLATYTMRNSGNVPVAVTLDKLSINPESSAAISLVEQFNTRDQELILALIAEKKDSGEQTTLGPLTENTAASGNAVSLNPFWEADAQADLYLAGNYSGPMIGLQHVSYRLTFSVSSLN